MKKFCFTSCFVLFFVGMNLFAQDGLNVFEDVKMHDKQEQAYTSSYYYNPSNMGDYSIYSTSLFSVNYNQEHKELHLFQKGHSLQQLNIDIDSYKKLRNNSAIWGAATYTNQVQHDVQWNNNIDVELIGPYVLADSVSNDMKTEAYEFSGGYTKTIGKWSLGGQLGYRAGMGYKKTDPRPKSISSDMKLISGVGYRLTAAWKVDFLTGFHKYTQHTSVVFANQIQQAGLYQMQGLGMWNNYFSGKTAKAIYEMLGYTFGGGFSRHHDFYIAFRYGSDTMTKDVLAALGSSTDGYVINNLKSDNYNLMIAKFFTIDTTSKIALKYQMQTIAKQGIDIYYSNNEDYLKKLMEKKRYNFSDSSHFVEVYYRKLFPTSQLTLQPFWMYKTVTESMQEALKKQQFSSTYLGLNSSFLHQLTDVSTLELRYAFKLRNTVRSTNALQTPREKQSIVDWLENDFEFLGQHYLQNGIDLQYTFKYRQFPLAYLALRTDFTRFSNKKINHYIGASLGVHF